MTTSIPKVSVAGEHSAEELMRLYRIQPSHLEVIRGMRDRARPRIDGVIEHFYQWMGEHPAMMAFLPFICKSIRLFLLIGFFVFFFQPAMRSVAVHTLSHSLFSD